MKVISEAGPRRRRDRALTRRILSIAAMFAASTVAAPAEQNAPRGSQPQTSTATTTPSATQPAISTEEASLKGMSLEDLMNVEVTSVAKRETTVGESPAAISVITQEDIRRSGATNIPEALRMVPGLEVAQIDSNGWAISSRGFNSQDANKLLVLIDGRSVYTPLFGGVFWDVQDTVMQDIDRIEVIRGPAGLFWGENAVNGVINVITKSAKESQGLLFVAGGGTLERAFASARYGWKINDDLYARVYVKNFERDQTVLATNIAGAHGQTLFTKNSGGGDAWQMTQAGFRLDYQPSKDNHYDVHGDIYGGFENNLVTVNSGDTSLSGGNLVALWTHDLGNGSDFRLQTYYDSANHTDLPFSERRSTADVDFQNHLRLDSRQDFTWGLDYRVTWDRLGTSVTPAETLGFDPNRRATQVVSTFAQYEVQLIPDRLRLTLGTKVEHDDFSGFDVQPNARLLWTINKQQTAWGAVSRAVRTPTRLDEDVRGSEQVPGLGNLLILRGNHDFQPESVLAYELGYRVAPIKYLSFDAATYYNIYTHVESVNNVVSLADLPIVFGNESHGDTYGAEVGSTWQAAPWWTLRAAYTYLQVRLVADRGSTVVPQSVIAHDDPNNQFYIRSSMDFPHRVQLDISARYVEDLPNLQIPSYIAVDARLSWQANDHLELSVVGQNLLDNQHPEFRGNYSTASVPHEIPRSVYGMMTYRW